MDANILIGILTLVITVILGLYIAYKQGAFDIAKVEIYPGFYNDIYEVDEKILKNQKEIWAVINSAPKRKYDYFFAFSPYLIKNTGDKPLENILFQISYNIALNDVELYKKLVKKYWSDEPIYNYDIERFVKIIYDKIYIEYKIPCIPPKSILPIPEFFLISKKILNDNFISKDVKLPEECINGKQIIIENVRCYFSSKSLKKPKSFKHLFFMFSANSIEELMTLSERPLYNLHRKNCPDFFELVRYPRLYLTSIFLNPIPWKFWYSLFFRDCIMKKRFVYLTSSSDIGIIDGYDYKNDPLIIGHPIESLRHYVCGFDETGFPVKGFKFQGIVEK